MGCRSKDLSRSPIGGLDPSRSIEEVPKFPWIRLRDHRKVLAIVLSSYYSETRTNSDSRSQYIIDNIMNSTTLMKSFADKIVVNCSNTAIVSFGMDGSDWVKSYYIQSDGTTKLNKCVKPENAPNPLPWGLSICL